MDRYSEDWFEIALKAKHKANWTCEKCGECYFPDYPGNVGVHHKDMDKTNNDPSNLMVLCWPCHRELHRRDDPLFCHGEEPEDYWRLGLPPPVRIKEVIEDVLPRYLKIQRKNLGEVTK